MLYTTNLEIPNYLLSSNPIMMLFKENWQIVPMSTNRIRANFPRFGSSAARRHYCRIKYKDTIIINSSNTNSTVWNCNTFTVS